MKNVKIKQLLQTFVLVIAVAFISLTQVSPVGASTVNAEPTSYQNNSSNRSSKPNVTRTPLPPPPPVSWNG